MKRFTSLLVCILLAITVIVFYPVIDAGFVNFDDTQLVLRNGAIRSLSPGNIVQLFTAPQQGLYHPLVTLSWALECAVAGGPSAVISHSVNLYLHLFNSLLVFWLFVLLTRKRWSGFIVAILFAVHPLHVESVAWVSERKDVLYAFFFLSGMIFYALFQRKGGMKYYSLAFAASCLSLLSKPMAVTLPLVFLLMDYFSEGKITRRRLAEKLPFFCLAALLVIVTVFAQHAGTPGTGISLRSMALVPLNMVFYVNKLLWPVHLSCLYPFSDTYGFFHDRAAALLLTFSAFLLLSLAVYRASSKFRKAVIFGIAFYIVTLLPATNLIPFGLGVVADRYTYIPALGLFLVVAEGFSLLFYRNYFRNRRKRIILILLAGVVASALAFAARQRSIVWKDSLSLWTDVLKNYPRASLAHTNRGQVYMQSGDAVRAMADFDAAISLNPGDVEAINNRAGILLALGNPDEALNAYRRLIEIDPRSAMGYLGQGNVLKTKGDYDGAIPFYTKAADLDSRCATAYFNRAVSHYNRGRIDAALADFQTAADIDPYDAETYFALGEMYRLRQVFPKAVDAYARATALVPRYAAAYCGQADAFRATGEYDKAIDAYTKVLAIDPAFPEAPRKREETIALKGRNTK